MSDPTTPILDPLPGQLSGPNGSTGTDTAGNPSLTSSPPSSSREDDVLPASNLPISRATLLKCLDSAAYWSLALPKYRIRMRKWSNIWAFSASILTTVTTLSVWSLVTSSKDLWAQLLISASVLLTGICGFVPRLWNFSAEAAAAEVLMPGMKHVYGLLLDLHKADDAMLREPIARQVHAEYERLDARTRQLNYLRDRPLKPANRDADETPQWQAEEIKG